MRLVAHRNPHCSVGRMGPLTPLFHDADHKPTSALGVAFRQKSVKDLIKDPRIMAQCGIHPTLLPPVPSAPHPTSISPPSSSYPLSFHAADKKFDSPLSSASACLRFCINLALIQNLALFPLAHLRTTRTTPTIQPTNSLEPGCLSPLNPPLAPANPLLSSSPSVRPSAKLHCLQRPQVQVGPKPPSNHGYRHPKDKFFDALPRRRRRQRHSIINQHQPFPSSGTRAFISDDLALFSATSVSPENGCRDRRCYD